MNRSTRLAARLWWATLSYRGWATTTAEDIADGANPPPWYAHPLAWLNKLAEKLPGSEPFEPLPPIVCTGDYCRGVPGARFEP
jgi:hypothetical protein